MSRIIVSLALAASLVAGGLVYPMTAQVVEVNRNSDTVLIECANGNLWAFYGCEDWAEGDLCACVMFSNGTPEIYDDVILRTAYVGTPDMFREVN